MNPGEDPLATSISGDTVRNPAEDLRSRLDEPMPDKIGRYEVQGVLGKGGFGIVYLAHDSTLRRKVAIKVPRTDRIFEPHDAESYLTEARTLASLSHPHIVPVHDAGQMDDGRCFVVSEFIEGSTLATSINQHRPSNWESAELIAIVADALHYAHRRKLIHRDVKPANILIDSTRKPYVADFGIALTDEEYGKHAGLTGTVAYMSPEQVRGEGHLVDGRSDIFSLGVVFYELLTGERPFIGSHSQEIIERIKRLEARPPRQLDDTIPDELERICLKALSKRATDRYTTALGMVDDLQHFLSSQQVNQASASHRQSNSQAVMEDLRRIIGTSSSTSKVDQCSFQTPSREDQGDQGDEKEPIKIIPKGLRSFDAADADFFLDLLPGPRNRHGLPETIRFWITRIEENDPDKTFRVGLIYGPSGSGKSSLVKAGLLPRLSDDVVIVYVESTPDSTEKQILRGIHKAFPDLSPASNLVDTLACLRRRYGAPLGQKVLIVLDQFEQWLHAKRAEKNTELAQSLRHCDGAGMQCLVMVRDDFWLAVSRFMDELEINLVLGQNTTLVDLFDQLHAGKVLAELGRSHGRLPENLGTLSKDQETFLDEVVEGLSQDGKIIAVRLALFAEMVKGAPWTPATLSELGGTEGVGVSFLEEMFSARTANPKHRRYQRAARSVLKAMLPEHGTDIRGHVRSETQLMEACGYVGQPQDFGNLMQILDSETRLLSPTDPEGAAADDEEPTSTQEVGKKYYQLTHDYLVPSLRKWLTRKQKETRRGRAELRLAERSGAWNEKPRNLYLPALWEWANIRIFTQQKDWSDSQRKMMEKATVYHGIRTMVGFLLLTVLTVSVVIIRNNMLQQRQIDHANSLVNRLLAAKIDKVPDIVDEFEGFRQWTDGPLKETFAQASQDSSKKINVALALLPVDEAPWESRNYLIQRLVNCSIEEFPVIRDSLAPHREQLLDSLWTTLQLGDSPEGVRFFAAMALAQYAPQSEQWTEADADFVVDKLLGNNLDDHRILRTYVAPIRKRLIQPLVARFRRSDPRDPVHLSAANAIVNFANDRPELLAELASEANSEQYRILFPQLAHDSKERDTVLHELMPLVGRNPESSFSEDERVDLGRRRAGAAITLLRLGQRESVFDVFRVDEDPESLTQFVHRQKERGVTPTELIECLELATEERVKFALLLALGEFTFTEVPAHHREPLSRKLLRWYSDDPSSAIHSAAGWLLRAWGFHDQVAKVDHTPQPFDEMGPRQWFVQQIGEDWFTFVVFRGGEFDMGSPQSEDGHKRDERLHDVKLTRLVLAVADREITRGQFQRFLAKTSGPKKEIDKSSLQHPMGGVMWYEAVSYCRWLTEQAGLSEVDQCYQCPDSVPDEQKEEVSGSRLFPRNWPFDYRRRGFRLPTEAEWECVCRGGVTSAFAFGNDRDLLSHYGWFKHNANKKAHATAQLRPNLRGLFDVHGNVYEWCHDWYSHGLHNGETHPVGPVEPKVGEGRVLRGGDCENDASRCRSAYRNEHQPADDDKDYGFRIVFTISGYDP